MSSCCDLVLDPVTTTGVLSAKLWIRRGSSADPRGQRGGHQLLGSVLSRGCGPVDHLQLADLVEGCGAGLRCDTHEDGILISLKCRDIDADRLLPALGWMLRQPHLDEAQIELEKDLSLQALQRQKEDPFHRAFDGWRQLAYGRGPYGHDPLGIGVDLEQLQKAELSCLAADLESRGSVLALSGTIPEGAKERLEEWLGTTKTRFSCEEPGTTIQESPELDPGKSSSLSLQALATEQVVLMLGQAALPHGHPDDLALRLLQAHLGSGMSSLLFRRLREEHGVAYDVGVHHPARAGAAPFVMHASTGVDRAELSLELLISSWSELMELTISELDLNLAKAKFRGQLAHGSQTTGQRAERRAQLRGLRLPDDHDQSCLNQLEQLRGTDLREAARRHLQSPQLSLCGPEVTLASLEKQWSLSDFAAGAEP
ncbi:pitrilysin family protein [Synechococcus sp. MIT S9504]|uniref:M16 family metallopeptidase n=1 Tax=Synechococcus sp. MIT S9504 TaxID=1801628 RepID=UPI0009ED1321|nr:pitrilysin family protein [Synechococcus sp. MIT S9504]